MRQFPQEIQRLVSTHHDPFNFGEVFLVNSEPKCSKPKSSMGSSFLGDGVFSLPRSEVPESLHENFQSLVGISNSWWGFPILGEVRTKTNKSSMRSSNSWGGGWFLVSFYPKSIHENFHVGYSLPGIGVYCVILTIFFPTQPSFYITDVCVCVCVCMCVYVENNKKNNVVRTLIWIQPNLHLIICRR